MNIGQWVLVKAVVVKQRDTEGNVSIWRCPCKPFRAQVTGSRVTYHGEILKRMITHRSFLSIRGSVLVRQGARAKEYQVQPSDMYPYGANVDMTGWQTPMLGRKVEYRGACEKVAG